MKLLILKFYFKIINIANFVSKNIPVPTITQFELFATKLESNIRIYLQNDFRQSGINIELPIQYETFVKWIYQDHVIYLDFSFKQVAIATSLIYLDEIEFIDNLGSNPGISHGNLLNFLLNFLYNRKC